MSSSKGSITVGMFWMFVLSVLLLGAILGGLLA